MPTQYLKRKSTTAPATAKGHATPIYVDADDNKLKMIPAASGTTEVEILDVYGTAPISVTGSSVTFGPTHVGRPVLFNRAAGIAGTLPAATGTGNRYEVIVATTFTGAATIAVPNATDYFIGTATLYADGGATVVGFATANTGTVATEDDIVSLFGTANSQGGFKGARIVFTDIAAAVWHVDYTSDAGGTEATPFSSGV